MAKDEPPSREFPKRVKPLLTEVREALDPSEREPSDLEEEFPAPLNERHPDPVFAEPRATEAEDDPAREPELFDERLPKECHWPSEIAARLPDLEPDAMADRLAPMPLEPELRDPANPGLAPPEPLNPREANPLRLELGAPPRNPPPETLPPR